jgi:hypothetical protein
VKPVLELHHYTLSTTKCKIRILLKVAVLRTRVSIYSSYFFIRIMNNFGLLFEYLNIIQILILHTKLPILAQKKKLPKILNCVEITEYHVLGLICTQKSQQITKLVLSMFLVIFLEKMSQCFHFYMVYKVKIYYSNIRSKII